MLSKVVCIFALYIMKLYYRFLLILSCRKSWKTEACFEYGHCAQILSSDVTVWRESKFMGNHEIISR